MKKQHKKTAETSGQSPDHWGGGEEWGITKATVCFRKDDWKELKENLPHRCQATAFQILQDSAKGCRRSQLCGVACHRRRSWCCCPDCRPPQLLSTRKGFQKTAATIHLRTQVTGELGACPVKPEELHRIVSVEQRNVRKGFLNHRHL